MTLVNAHMKLAPLLVRTSMHELSAMRRQSFAVAAFAAGCARYVSHKR